MVMFRFTLPLLAAQAHRPLLRALSPPDSAHVASLPNGDANMEDGEAEEGELEEGEAHQENGDTAMLDARAEGACNGTVLGRA